MFFIQDLISRLSLDEMVAQMSRGGASKNGKLKYVKSSINTPLFLATMYLFLSYKLVYITHIATLAKFTITP